MRIITLVLALVATMLGLGASPAVAAETRPNIVLITVDDMTDYELRWMPKTRRLLKSQGTEFTDFINPHPLCCPARAEILTGQYAHNNGVRHNNGPWGGEQALRDPTNTIGSWLQSAGYKTSFVGKFINGRGLDYDIVQDAGWDNFNPSVEGKGTYAPFGFTMWDNGKNTRVENVYTTDYVRNATRRYIRQSAGEPFFIWASQIAPHGMFVNNRWTKGPIPAPRHADLFPNAEPPSLRKASAANLSEERKNDIRRKFLKRIRSLQAVDEATVATVRALRKAGVLDNTVIIFTSDNGYFLGEHGLVGKNYPYDENLQIPFLMRGPGIPAGLTRDVTATLVDLAPTLADIAGVTPARQVDGRSVKPMIRKRGHHTVLIQAGSENQPWYFRGVRTPKWTWVRYYGGGTELYNRANDPLQMQDLSGKRPRVESRLREIYVALKNCSGSTCHR